MWNSQGDGPFAGQNDKLLKVWMVFNYNWGWPNTPVEVSPWFEEVLKGWNLNEDRIQNCMPCVRAC